MITIQYIENNLISIPVVLHPAILDINSEIKRKINGSQNKISSLFDYLICGIHGYMSLNYWSVFPIR